MRYPCAPDFYAFVDMKQRDGFSAAYLGAAQRRATALRWSGAALLAMLGLPSFAASPLDLAHQVNTQIVTQQVIEEGQAFLRAFGSGQGISTPDDPPACRKAIEKAMAEHVAAGVRRVADGIQDPAYQAKFDRVLMEAYTPAELNAFLAQRGTVEPPTLSANVLAAPDVRAAHDARMEALTLGDPDPASPEGMGLQRAKETCDRLRAQSS
ncbi:hypothetical protein ABRP17_018005 [Stenotrophomonas sp. WHRI 8082]|uniref:hypothetical protein n=1 Tax=Stenotrophomonas sp. WHRI 8082 TaxID=3162571 RepID=UPI0032EFF0F8